MKTNRLNLKNTYTARYLFKRDNLLATILVFVLIGIFAKIEKEFSILDPKEISTKDFNFTDLSYHLIGKSSDLPHIDTGIVIVNIENYGRADIGRLIRKIADEQPKVIGVDILFDQAKNIGADSALKNISLHNKNVVMSFRLDSLDTPVGCFYDTSSNQGLVNFTTENQNVIREFDPFVTTSTKKYLSFAAAVVKEADEGAYDTLNLWHNNRQMINYHFTEDNYLVINADDLLKQNSLKASLVNKIVLLGYISPNKYDCTDKHFTPLNAAIAGRSLPDLNGVFIHANIVRMILNQDYIHRVPSWLNWVIAFIICWVHMAFFIGYFIEKHIWFHLAAKIVQLVSAVFFLYLGLFIFFKFDVAIDLTVTIFAIVLAVDVLYFYEAGVLWLHQKRGYKTLFHHEEHK